MITPDLLTSLIKQNGLEQYTADLLKMSRPAIHLKAAPVAAEGSLAPGSSKFGGAPDLPAGFNWPRWQNKPLTFMAQIHLSDVAAFDTEHLLPASGWLHFFYALTDQPWGAPDQRDSWHLYYTAEPAALNRVQPPEAALPARALSFGQNLTLPVLADDHPDGIYNLFAHGLPGQISVRAENIDDFDGLRQAAEGPVTPLHQLLGNPAQLQDDIRALAQYAANGIDTGAAQQDKAHLAKLASGIDSWRLLLQIDSDRDSFGTSWGDAGCMYLCITTAALVARQFDSAWLITQSD